MSALFVTGAGTDIGKTWVACALLKAWREAGIPCAALKPVVTGFDDAAIDGSDPALLLAALGRPVSSSAVASIAPWRFAAPLAAPMAARRENREVDFERVVSFCRKETDRGRRALLIEGAGGVMAPLATGRTNIDLIGELAIPSVLVAGTYLGAVSHALTAFECLRARSLAVAMIVVNESEHGVGLHQTEAMLREHARGTNIMSLARNSKRVVGRLPADLAFWLMQMKDEA